MPKETYRKLLKKKTSQKPLKYPKKCQKWKGMEMSYSQLEIQNYLSSEDIDITNF